MDVINSEISIHFVQLIYISSLCSFRCKGLMLLETYSSLDGEKLLNCLPKFLNIVKEVTGDPSFSMFNLSLKEDWSKTKKFCHSLHGKDQRANQALEQQQQQQAYHSSGNNANIVHTNGMAQLNNHNNSHNNAHCESSSKQKYSNSNSNSHENHHAHSECHAMADNNAATTNTINSNKSSN